MGGEAKEREDGGQGGERRVIAQCPSAKNSSKVLRKLQQIFSNVSETLLQILPTLWVPDQPSYSARLLQRQSVLLSKHYELFAHKSRSREPPAGQGPS